MSSQDQLLRHSFLLMLSAQVTNIANALFQVVMGRWLSAVEYGILAAMLAVILIAGMPLNALSNSLAFFSAQLLQQNRAGDIWRLLRSWSLKLLLTALLLLGGGLLASEALASFFQLPGAWAIILALTILALSFFPPLLGGTLQGIQAFGWAAFAGASAALARLLGGGLLVYCLAASAAWAILGHGLGVLVSAGLGLLGLMLALRQHPAPAGALPGAQAYFLRTLVVLAAFGFLMNADVLIVKHYFSPEQSGLFARAGTIGRAIIFLPMPIAGALFPKTVSNGAKSIQHDRLLWRALFYTLLIVIPGALLCSCWPQLPLGILYRDWQPSAEMCRLVRAMIWAMLPLSLAYIIMNFELSQNRFRIVWPLLLGMTVYLLGVGFQHATLLQISIVLAIVSGLTLLSLLKELPWALLKKT